MKTGTESIQKEPQLIDSPDSGITPVQARVFVTDVKADQFWINLLALNLGINTLFQPISEDMKEEKMWSILENLDGSVLAHPVLAKAMIMNYVTRSSPEIYSKMITGEFGSKQKAYFFKNWSWNRELDEGTKTWFSQSEAFKSNFALSEYTKIHSSVMERCLTTHVRDIFWHFGKPNLYGLFLSRVYEAGELPKEMLK